MWAFEGEGGLTTGATHETMNSAWGLALDNLYYVVDWNDFGIDDHAISTVVYGTPDDWFASHGWRVFGAELGNEWGPVTQAILQMVMQPNPERVPSVAWVKTRKGRGYHKYDNKSHGSPHKLNDETVLAHQGRLCGQVRRDLAWVWGAGPRRSRGAAGSI